MSTDSDIKTQNAETLADDGMQQASSKLVCPDFEHEMDIMIGVREIIGKSQCDETASFADKTSDGLRRAERGIIAAMTDCLAKMPPDENRIRLHYFLSEILFLIQISSFRLEEKA